MRKLTKLLVVFAMVLTASGATAATAAKPTPTPPIITIGAPTAVCDRIDADTAFDLEVISGEIGIEGGVMSNFNLDAARIGEVISHLLYPQTVRESWYYSWWDGSGDDAPTPSYTLNTADLWGGSWTGHQLGEPELELELGTVEYTNYWEVGVSVGAVTTQSKGRGGQQQARSWDRMNWYFQCPEIGGAVPQDSVTESPQFVWCWEDDYTYATRGEAGLVMWDEVLGDYVPCPLRS